MTCGIYMIVCFKYIRPTRINLSELLEDGYLDQEDVYCYIGSSKHIEERIKQHKSTLKNNKHCNSKLQNVYNKYGKSSFSHIILTECTEEERLTLEEQIIKEETPNLNLQWAGREKLELPVSKSIGKRSQKEKPHKKRKLARRRC